MGNFLVVDFDYFFPNPFDGGEFHTPEVTLYDWQHAETPMHIDPPLWITRFQGFVNNGLPVPRVTIPEGGWSAWWDRFNIADDVPLLICDSNGWAGLEQDPNTSSPFESVWLYDAHHDAGYHKDAWPRKNREFGCEDWMLIHARAGTDPAELHVRYPLWKKYAFSAEPEPPLEIDRAFDDGSTPPVEFDSVLLCRSGAWVPPWCDHDFSDLCEAYPGDFVQIDNAELVRPFDVDEQTMIAEQLGEALRLMWEQHQQG